MSAAEKWCILVVDDQRLNRELLRAVLVPEGYRVVQAESGEQALAMITQGGIDLVLLDVLMPGLDGTETCRRIRAQLQLPLLPVIIISALTDADSVARFQDAGADGFLPKPIDDVGLLARIRSLLASRGPVAGP